jgi:hypothetical protein
MAIHFAVMRLARQASLQREAVALHCVQDKQAAALPDGASLASVEGHADSVFGAQGYQRFGNYGMAGDQLETIFLRDGG